MLLLKLPVLMRSWCSKEVELTLNSVSIVITLHAPTTEFAPQLFEDSLLGELHRKFQEQTVHSLKLQ